MIVLDVRVPDDGSIIDVEGLELAEGATTVVFGPNGAGKTTLLRELAGIGGDPIIACHYLPQRPHLFRGSAGWNLGLGLDAEEASWAAQKARLLGVGELLSSPSRQLSGGESQRLALARALASKEPWLLLDEPLAAIDHADRDMVLSGVSQELTGRSAVVVTHDLDVAAALGDRIALMEGGRLLQQGPIDVVLAGPASVEVARILGVKNLITGIASRRGNMNFVKSEAIEVAGTGDVEGRARAVFAAEAVTILPPGAPGGSARNRWTGTVADLRALGSLVEVVVDVGQPVVAVITPGASSDLELTVGARVDVAVKASAVAVIPA